MMYLLVADGWLRVAPRGLVALVEAPDGFVPRVIGAQAVPYTGQVPLAQTQQLRLANALTAEAAGYMDHDEASTLAVGHAAVGPALAGATAAAPDASAVNPEPGGNRLKQSCETDGRRDVPPVTDAVDTQLVARAIASWDRVFAETDYVGLLAAEIEEEQSA